MERNRRAVSVHDSTRAQLAMNHTNAWVACALPAAHGIQAPAIRPPPSEGATAEHNHADDLHHFFQAVSRELQGAEHVLVVGPSTAKLQFIHKHDPSLEPRIVGVETVDHPTDGQLVAYAKRYFASEG